jgi:2-polyprenyl-6-methoxyphenol hydroxylase-like FAD-dependent oxidoreductase
VRTPTPVARQAIVVGAGMAGLTAARALADHFEQVLVLERDTLPLEAAQRAGTPQARHVHALLASGQHAFGQLFPGIEGDFDRAGAVPLRAGLDIRLERPGFDPFPQRDLGWSSYALSRPLLEYIVRRRLGQHANVTLRQGCRVAGFLARPDGAAIDGIRCEASDGRSETLPADLVVDASGRGALTLDALRSIGAKPPQETAIGIDIAYATAVFAIPEDAPADWKGVMMFGQAPENGRGALMLPMEGQRWMLSLGEAHGQGLPGDAEGFLACVKTLRTPTIHNAIKHARRLGEVARFGFPASVRRHFEGLDGFPGGLLAIGDAFCRFNPVYGQGMSVAAQEASVLRGLLAARAAEREPLAGLAQEFFAETQALLETPWAVATFDFIFPQTSGQRPADFEGTLKFGIALTRLAARDPALHKLTSEVQQLLKPRSVYRDPELLRRVLAVMAEPKL